jgi:hypothetical protein
MPIWDLIRWIPNTSDSFRRPAADGSAKGDQGCLADLDERRGLNNKNADFICIYICMYIYMLSLNYIHFMVTCYMLIICNGISPDPIPIRIRGFDEEPKAQDSSDLAAGATGGRCL